MMVKVPGSLKPHTNYLIKDLSIAAVLLEISSFLSLTKQSRIRFSFFHTA